MVSIPMEQASAFERVADRRIHHRLAIKELRIAAIVQPATTSVAAVPGRLTNLSAGGCGIVASGWAVGRLGAGTRCTVSFPVHRQNLHYPATIVAVEKRDGGEVLLRVRFRKSDAVTQQQLTRWLSDLAVQSWHL